MPLDKTGNLKKGRVRQKLALPAFLRARYGAVCSVKLV
ncbi:hypothetical protein JOC69_002061 [Heliobacterium gestii]|nr:hypothetical protein [Heliomicrobium gestii]